MLMMKKNKTPKRILYIQRPNGGGSSMSLLELVKALDKKQVTYDFHRLMEGATKLKCSEFGQALVDNM